MPSDPASGRIPTGAAGRAVIPFTVAPEEQT